MTVASDWVAAKAALVTAQDALDTARDARDTAATALDSAVAALLADADLDAAGLKVYEIDDDVFVVVLMLNGTPIIRTVDQSTP